MTICRLIRWMMKMIYSRFELQDKWLPWGATPGPFAINSEPYQYLCQTNYMNYSYSMYGFFFNLLKSMWICSTHVGKVSDLIIKNSKFTNITKLPCFRSRNVKNKPGVECLTSNATITCKINKYFFPYCSWVFICLVMIRYFTAHDD